MAGFDKVDPANCVLDGPARDGQVGLQPNREMPTRWPDEGIPVVGRYALHRLIGVQGKMHVLTS